MQLQFITPVRTIDCPKMWREFQAAPCVKAELTITGLGLYRAFLNGERVGRDWLTPGFNDYDAYLRAQTYDVTELLQKENRLEVWLGNGWYKGRLGYDGGKRCIWGDKYLLALRLTMTAADGTVTMLETDESWLAAQSPIVSGDIYDGEVRDDTRPEGEAVPCVRTEWTVEPEAQFSPCIREIEARSGQLIITPAGEQVLDFGQNASGVIRFINRLPRGCRMRIQTGEVLQQGNFYRDNLRTALSEYTYISDGVQKEVDELFTFHGFRYIKVEGIEKVDPKDFTMVVLSSQLRNTLEVSTDLPGLNQLMQNSLWGQRSNFVDLPTDCPQRDERLGWTGDTQVFVNTACYQMDCKDFYRKFMRDLRADQLMYFDGDIPYFCPSMKKTAGHGGAVWADAGTIIPWNVYMNYGDMDLLRESYPMMHDYAEHLIAQDLKDGGTHLRFSISTFGDWLAQDGMTPQSLKGCTEDNYISACYYMNSIELTAEAARVLGEDADADRYGRQAQEIRRAILDEYVTAGGRLAMDTQTGYILALRYGMYRDKEKLLEGFRERIRRDSFKLTSGFTGAPLLLPVLLDNGMTDEAYRMLLTPEFPGWMYAVNLGATTIWERWNSLEEDGSISGTGMNSLNHYAYGSVCEAVYSRIMGLRNAAPGWKKAEIAPKLNGRIRHSHIAYDSPAGRWVVDWDIEEDGSFTLSAVIPDGCTATVILPDCDCIEPAEVGSGSYRWHYMPTRDYLHPWSLRSLVLDLMEDPEASALLREKVPVLWESASQPDSEARMMTLEKAGHTVWGVNPAEVEALEPLLRQIGR